MSGTANVLSVCRWLPTPDNTTAGIFILRRLEAMTRFSKVAVHQPIPYFPVLRSVPDWALAKTRRLGDLRISSEPMFYVPKVLKSLDGYWLYRSIAAAVGEAHAAGRVDLIDAHFGYPDGVGAFLAARRFGIPLFLTFRGLEADYVDDPWISLQIRRALDYALGCICVGHSLRDLALRFGADERKLCVIHNAVDRTAFTPGSRSEARAALALPQSGTLIVSVGHLLSVKGHHTLLDAFARLRTRAPNARLAIIGGAAHEPGYPGQLASQALALGIHDSVMFVGRVPPSEVSRWLRAADAFALASAREGCCNAVLEALATGIPVVTTPVGDNPYFVKDGRNGFLVAVGDPEALAEALARAVSTTEWDTQAIVRDLPAGDWKEVGARIVEFFNERLHAGALIPAVPH